jgi:hypothetical protein
MQDKGDVSTSWSATTAAADQACQELQRNQIIDLKQQLQQAHDRQEATSAAQQASLPWPCVCVCGQSSKHTASDTLTPHMSGGFTVSKKLRKL